MGPPNRLQRLHRRRASRSEGFFASNTHFYSFNLLNIYEGVLFTKQCLPLPSGLNVCHHPCALREMMGFVLSGACKEVIQVMFAHVHKGMGV